MPNSGPNPAPDPTPALPALARRLRHLAASTHGTVATEYALIAIAAACAISTLGSEVNRQYSGLDRAVHQADCQLPPFLQPRRPATPRSRTGARMATAREDAHPHG